MRRPLWLAAGVAVGVGGTLWAEQRVRRQLRKVTDRLSPVGVASDAAGMVRGQRQRVLDALEAGRRAREHREQELWQEYGAGAAPPPPAAPAHRAVPRRPRAHR